MPFSPRPRAVLDAVIAMTATSAVLGVLVAGLALPLTGLVGLGVVRAGEQTTDLTAQLTDAPLAERSEILDADGRPLARIFEVDRVTVRLDDVPRRMVAALLAIEDHRFYEHGALDLQGTLRALLANGAASGVVQGGSTLTQQLVKLSLLEEARSRQERARATEQTLARKVRELRAAIALEQEHSKDWILERYLNVAYFGAGAYGVEAAAQRYFSVSVSDLAPDQAAMLAGLVRSPVGGNPLSRPERARERRDVVLQRLADLDVVGQRQAARLAERPLGLRPSEPGQGCVASSAPLFCDYVVATLLRDDRLGPTRAARYRLLRTGGLRIRTSLDPQVQASATAAVARAAAPTDLAIAAVAVVEPGTGDVLALAQSRPYGPDSAAGSTFVNVTTPREAGGARGFQGGSTFKTFVLAAALEAGVPLDRTYRTPNELTLDQADFANCPGAAPFGGEFTVRNAAVPSSGLENAYTATRRSINTYFLQLTREIGVCEPFRLARRMGVRLTAPTGSAEAAPERVPIFPLGVADVSPLELAEAYATFAARGTHCTSRPVQSLTDAAGAVVARTAADCAPVMASSTADAVNDVLSGVLAPGGFAAAQAPAVPAAGKTGNNEGSSVWFAGYTPQVAAAAVLAGAEPDGSPRLLDGTTVAGRTVVGAAGSQHAAPIWGEVMRTADDDLDPVPFVYPSGVPGVGQTAPDPRALDADGSAR